jgi:hypothetical protein
MARRRQNSAQQRKAANTMKKILLAATLALCLLLNGCAITIPWWLFLKNDPSRARQSAGCLITEQSPAEPPMNQQHPAKSDWANSPESPQRSAP